jgi:primosomal protein N' (replication factor Y) (superfamily II helicase)
MSKEPCKYAELIIPLAVPQYYTYKIPEEFEDRVKPGCRVTVVLGKRRMYTGIVRSLQNNPPEGFDISEILDVLDEKPLASEKQMQFWEWISDYYMCTNGEVYRAALPSGLKLESESKVFLSDLEEEPEGLTASDYRILDLLEQNPGITLHKLTELLSRKNIMPIIKQLLEKNVITLEENLKESYHPLTIDYVKLNEQIPNEKAIVLILETLEKRAPKQAELLLEFLKQTRGEQERDLVVKNKLLKSADASHAVLKGLVKKKIFEIITKEVSRLGNTEETLHPPKPLNNSQEQADKEINSFFREKDVVLLHGVTSSGKTEIYIHSIAEQIAKGKEVLYLLPEIALTTQIIQRLRNVFGNKVGVYHSKFSDDQRVEVYRNLAGLSTEDAPHYQLILGVRSSIFLPFSDLGLIIVDEEHENTYKQFDPAPRYNARDAAVVLAGMHGAKVLMGTATPSFESYLNALNGRYGLVDLTERYREMQLPEIEVINVREARRRKLMKTHFSPILLDEMEETLANHEQIILFQNRRGFSPYIECIDCGWIPYCKNCDVTLTYHKKTNRLICHYCGYGIAHPPHCISCGSNDVRTRGFGTEKVEDEIASIFPDAKVSRMDLDTTRTRRSYERIINDFENRKIDILIGTQMVSKGLDFDHVRLVGILNADNMLNFPDFRSWERSFQLIAQVSGRAGRKNKRGKVIIQTGDPGNIVIKKIIENDYKGFFMQQLAERKTFKYPPYFRLVKLTLRHKLLPKVSKAATLLAEELRKKLGNRVVGPEFPLINRVFNYHQKCIIVKIERDKHFTERRKLMRDAIDRIYICEEFKGIQIVPDVDPYN